MTSREHFLQVYYGLPEKARTMLVYDAYGPDPWLLNVIAIEVEKDTELGNKILKEMGF